MHQEDFLTYLYCFCEEKPILPEMSFSQKLSILPTGNFFAVTESVPTTEFGERELQTKITDMAWLVPKVNTHEGVIQHVMEQTTVLPVKFATIFSNKSKIQDLVKANDAAYVANFAKLKNKQEWGIKIYSKADDEWLINNTTDEELRSLQVAIAEASPGKAFMMKKKLNTLISNKRSSIYKDLGKDLYAQLQQNTETSLQKSILPAQAEKNTKEKMVLNAVFLIPQNQVYNWLQHIKNLEQKIDNNNITFNVSGPWPPYHFMD